MIPSNPDSSFAIRDLETSHDLSSAIVNLGVLWLLMVPSAAVLGATVVALRRWGVVARRALRRATVGRPILNRAVKMVELNGIEPSTS